MQEGYRRLDTIAPRRLAFDGRHGFRTRSSDMNRTHSRQRRAEENTGGKGESTVAPRALRIQQLCEKLKRLLTPWQQRSMTKDSELPAMILWNAKFTLMQYLDRYMLVLGSKCGPFSCHWGTKTVLDPSTRFTPMKMIVSQTTMNPATPLSL